jgi:hypothetical protein
MREKREITANTHVSPAQRYIGNESLRSRKLMPEVM